MAIPDLESGGYTVCKVDNSNLWVWTIVQGDNLESISRKCSQTVKCEVLTRAFLSKHVTWWLFLEGKDAFKTSKSVYHLTWLSFHPHTVKPYLLARNLIQIHSSVVEPFLHKTSK